MRNEADGLPSNLYSSSKLRHNVRFTVGGLPTGAVVQNAKLRLYVTNDSTSGGSFNTITNTSWAETITWNSKPTIDGLLLATLGAVSINLSYESVFTHYRLGHTRSIQRLPQQLLLECGCLVQLPA